MENKTKATIMKSESNSERRFLIESREETPLAKLLPFLIERVISNRVNLQTVKKKLKVAIYF